MNKSLIIDLTSDDETDNIPIIIDLTNDNDNEPITLAPIALAPIDDEGYHTPLALIRNRTIADVDEIRSATLFHYSQVQVKPTEDIPMDNSGTLPGINGTFDEPEVDELVDTDTDDADTIYSDSDDSRNEHDDEIYSEVTYKDLHKGDVIFKDNKAQVITKMKRVRYIDDPDVPYISLLLYNVYNAIESDLLCPEDTIFLKLD